MSKANDKLQADIDRVVEEYKQTRKIDPDLSAERVRFDAMIWRMVTTSKKELDRRLAADKKKKDETGAKRYPK